MIYDLQKASILKRISAWLLDFICVCILAVGVAALVMVIAKFDNTYQSYADIIDSYSEEYGIDLRKTLPEDATGDQKALYQTAYADFAKDADANVLYLRIISVIFMAVTLGLFFARLITEFIIPLCLKNGQTVGKKVFSIGVMQVTGVRITPFILFVRGILGKYTVETMIPLLLILMFFMNIGGLVMLMVLAAILILQLVLVIATKNNSLIHDALSSTVTIDMQTQMVFDTKADMISYKEQVSQAEAEKAEYK